MYLYPSWFSMLTMVVCEFRWSRDRGPSEVWVTWQLCSCRFWNLWRRVKKLADYEAWGSQRDTTFRHCNLWQESATLLGIIWILINWSVTDLAKCTGAEQFLLYSGNSTLKPISNLSLHRALRGTNIYIYLGASPPVSKKYTQTWSRNTNV